MISTLSRFAVLSLVVATTRLSPAAEPIRLHPDNPHYFLFRGKPAALIGSTEHYGAVLNLDFDYRTYLDELKAHDLNLTRVFSGVYCEPPGAFKIRVNTLAPAAGKFITPWARSEAPGYAGGGNKFDLERFDPAYFQRLRDFLREAGERGIVVELSLFCPFYEDAMWNLSPLNVRNNVNGVGDMARTDVYALKDPAVTDVQTKLVRKLAAELQSVDNVYFEVCNEPYFGGVTLEWQDRIIAAIVEAERDLPAKHLIAQNIANGSQKIERPNPAVSLFNFHYCTPPNSVAMNYELNKAIGDDETGFRGSDDAVYRGEGWDFILAGGSLYDNLDYSFTASHEDGAAEPDAPGGGGRELRRQLHALKAFLESFDFLKLKPDNSVVKSGVPRGATVRVLAEAGRAYALYLRGGSQARLTLSAPAGRYRAEWVNPRNGAVERREDVEHRGGEFKLESPTYSEDIALRIKRIP